MPFNEADTRAKLIDPALHDAGWSEDWIRREQTPGPVIRLGATDTRGAGRTDYLLHVLIKGRRYPIALVEAKPESADPAKGLEQAKGDARTHHVPFAFSSNGHQFVEANLKTNETRGPLPMKQFSEVGRPPRTAGRNGAASTLKTNEAVRSGPRPATAPATTRRPHVGPRLKRSPAARTAFCCRLQREPARRGSQSASSPRSIRPSSSVARSSSATGTGFAHRRSVRLADTSERTPQPPPPSGRSSNARVIVATYQTLGVDSEDGTASFLTTHYPPNHFSHIIIDECHRSAWGKWSEVLKRNPDAVQIGLTATPREIDTGDASDVDAAEDNEITANNYEYFGNPVYEYSIAQGMDDGYLAAMEVARSDVWTAGTLDRMEGVERENLKGAAIAQATTGQAAVAEDLRERYGAGTLEQDIQLPDRVGAMCSDLFAGSLTPVGRTRRR